MSNIRNLLTSLFFVFLTITGFAQKSGKLIASTKLVTEVQLEFDTLHLYSENFNGLDQIDSIVPKYEIFLTGENHTYTESNARLWLKMIKYLHKNAGVRNIMFEYGFSYGWLVNEYLQTGDSVLFNSIKNFAYVEYSNAIKELREFNANLDSANRIYLTAIDIERGVYPVVKLLDYITPKDQEPHDSIKLHIESIHSLASYNDAKLYEQEVENKYTKFNFLTHNTLKLVQTNFRKFEAEYKSLLGERFELFKSVITTKFDARKKWMEYEESGVAQQYVFRETYMHQTFLNEYDNQTGAWFGQFGRCHTTQAKQTTNSCDWYDFKSLANRIKNSKDEQFKQCVMTIAIIYNTDRNLGKDKLAIESEFDKYFNVIPEKSIVLFDLSENEILDSVMSDDFNYVFLNSDDDRGEAYAYLESYYGVNDGVKIKLGVGYQFKKFDLTKLNNVFTDNLAEGVFSEDFQAWEFLYMVGENNTKFGSRYYTGMTLGYYISQRINTANFENHYDFNGFYVREFFFWNLLPKFKGFDFMPGLGLGYERLKLLVTEETTSIGNVNEGFLGVNKITTYTNPAFTLDLNLLADLNFGPIYIGYNMGYTLDLSKKYWLSNNSKVGVSPNTSLGGYYNTFKLGVVF